MDTRRSGWANGRGRSSTALMTEKMAVFAPIPSPRVRIATAANPGLRRSVRSAYLMSFARCAMAGVPFRSGGGQFECLVLDDAAIEEMDRAVGVTLITRIM